MFGEHGRYIGNINHLWWWANFSPTGFVCVRISPRYRNKVHFEGNKIQIKESHDKQNLTLMAISHTCDISRFRRELPIWSLSSRPHARGTKPPDERFFQCHFSRTVFQSEHFIVYGSIYLANKLFTAQKCLTFIDLIDDHWCVSASIDAIKIDTCGQLNRPDMSLLSLYYHVSGQSSSANEKASYFILMNIHKKRSHDRWMNSANYSRGGIISQIL